MCGGRYGPTEGVTVESERFWNDLNGVVDSISNEYRL